jgi:SPX domain protein involved in polyphosphate accumulation
LEDAIKNLHSRGKGKDANDKFKKIFTECQQAVDSKQLLPLVRTQYMRTAFQVHTRHNRISTAEKYFSKLL